MPAPGWNVTEPISLAYRLYRIAQQLQYAPESAKELKSKIEDFDSSLRSLQEVLDKLDGSSETSLSAHRLAQLRKEVVQGEKCIKRCEDFIADFPGITSDGSKRAAGAGAALWLWKKDRAEKLTEQMESHIRHISFILQINTFAQAHSPQGNTRRNSKTEMQDLPPYTCPPHPTNPDTYFQRQPQTPSSFLNIQLPPIQRNESGGQDVTTTHDDMLSRQLDSFRINVVIPHVEHPEASGSIMTYQVKLERTEFSSERVRSSSLSGEPAGPSSASARSRSSLSSSADSATITREHHRQVFEFDNKDDYKTFQEMVLGPEVELQAQIPAWKITSKCFNGAAATESKQQSVRLWRRGRHQYLLFFANKSSETYKEFRMSCFTAKEKSETMVKFKLDSTNLNHQPGSNAWDGSFNHSYPTYQDAALPNMGLTRLIDTDELKNLEYVAIEFEDSKGKTSFMQKANFSGFVDDPVSPTVTFAPRLSTG
ncbi:uncharacterized protein KY384_001793 [Bacidia gigantensis]|uniref:uncharacterized protein n=1 Tax=Bacidia gigantensis TaxID=2732470 RepID=UPI001D04583D|nr:uncharacterized protein KY384_001793 [Bacidia gigantensis]KAG8533011.1 hypothetical protein KY384_001793 [Bacidia gigantensis]